MKKSIKHFLFSYFIVGTLLLFFAFSNGLSFSLHYCDYCQQTKLFLYQHPNCCEESSHIHESEKQCNESCGCSHDKDSHADSFALSAFNHSDEEKTLHNTSESHGCSCTNHKCKTTHKYLRITSPYLHTIKTVILPTAIATFTEIEIAEEVEIVNFPNLRYNNNSPPLITNAGNRDFIHFISQQVLYA